MLAGHDTVQEQLHGVAEVALLLLLAAEHAEVGHPRGHGLDQREEVLGGRSPRAYSIVRRL